MLTSDDLRRWADHLDNPGEIPKPLGVNPAHAEELLVAADNGWHFIRSRGFVNAQMQETILRAIGRTVPA